MVLNRSFEFFLSREDLNIFFKKKGNKTSVLGGTEYVALHREQPILKYKRSVIGLGDSFSFEKNVWFRFPNVFWPKVDQLGFHVSRLNWLFGNEVYVKCNEEADKLNCVLLVCILWVRKWAE